MNLPDLSIKRPIFITCIFFLIVVLGAISFGRIGVDLFPNVNFPIVLVTTTYSGAGPAEIESLVTRPLEDALSTVSGVKNLRSTNNEGVSMIIVEFTLDTDSKYAEQQVKDRVTTAISRLPDGADTPITRAFDPADQPILTLALTAKKAPADLYDLADREIRPLIEQVKNVGFVDVVGGRKREIHVLLDRNKLKNRMISATAVVNSLATSGKNIPAGKAMVQKEQEAVVRTLGEYDSLGAISKTLVNFYGNERPVEISDVGTVIESLEDERTRTTINGVPSLSLMVYRRSGANTIAVANAVKKRVEKIRKDYAPIHEGFDISVVQDGGKPIQDNVDDVTESIILGIVLTILVVFFFLGSARSTFITGIALPNSLLGAFILMSAAGFTINIMTLLALSLAVGLLIDDAIVVRENIFRHIEEGMEPEEAASKGTREVTLAVIATTMTVIAVFGPVAFLQGIVGQFFKEFGLTICFAMTISLFDALTMAPMLSAYFAGNLHGKRTNIVSKGLGMLVDQFDRIQTTIEDLYVRALKIVMNHSLKTLGAAFLIFILSFVALKTVPKTFTPPQDTGEFNVSLELPPGTDIEQMADVTLKVDQTIRSNREVKRTVVTVGGRNGEENQASLFIKLIPSKERNQNTSQMKERVRTQLAQFRIANPKVQDQSGIGGNQQPLNVNIIGADMNGIKKVAEALYEKIKNHPDLKDVDISYREGKPEYRVVIDKAKAESLGVTTTAVGEELRTLIEGRAAAVYRRDGREYNIRVRLQEDQRNIKNNFQQTLVPNVNQRLIRLSDVSNPLEVLGPSTIYRQNRGRYIQISAALNPTGKGLGNAIQDIQRIMDSKEIEMPPGVSYQFVGQAESFQELIINMMIAAGLAVLFIYLVLASLYESFITPFTIMLVLPLAVCGAFYALAITGASFDIFSMIGCVMLLGVATKNSILLVDYVNQLVADGKPLKEAILQAGKVRLRPIIMTTLALIAGMLPVAIGLNEASKSRTSMGIAVIGGLVSSTLLTLVVVPAAYSYIERFRLWTNRVFFKVSKRKIKGTPRY